MKTFVLGDIHGAHQALTQCLERSGFRRGEDRLIVLGDICDVYPQSRECVEELVQIPHCHHLIGNHDIWALEWAQSGIPSEIWLENGGKATRASYGEKTMPKTHIDFYRRALPFLELEERLFVHAGFNPLKPVRTQGIRYLAWDRELVTSAHDAAARGKPARFGDYTDIFVGHTPTQQFGKDTPQQFGNVWLLDTGAGWSGKLSIMDVATKEYWQSDLVPSLYGVKGRGL